MCESTICQSVHDDVCQQTSLKHARKTMTVDPSDFMKRLDAISEHNGVPYGRVHLIFDEEEEYGYQVINYKGYLALSDACKCFFS
jgi:hypothetical protein